MNAANRLDLVVRVRKREMRVCYGSVFICLVNAPREQGDIIIKIIILPFFFYIKIIYSKQVIFLMGYRLTKINVIKLN